MNVNSSPAISVVPFVAFWVGIATIGFLLLAFVGVAYLFLLAALLHLITATVLAIKPTRARVAAAFWYPKPSWQKNGGPSLTAISVVAFLGLVWLGLGCALLAAENITLAR